MQQWWLIKEEYFDAIVCFKIAKFYILFHMDAVIGCKELGIQLMNVGGHNSRDDVKKVLLMVLIM